MACNSQSGTPSQDFKPYTWLYSYGCLLQWHETANLELQAGISKPTLGSIAMAVCCNGMRQPIWNSKLGLQNLHLALQLWLFAAMAWDSQSGTPSWDFNTYTWLYSYGYLLQWHETANLELRARTSTPTLGFIAIAMAVCCNGMRQPVWNSKMGLQHLHLAL